MRLPNKAKTYTLRLIFITQPSGCFSIINVKASKNLMSKRYYYVSHKFDYILSGIVCKTYLLEKKIFLHMEKVIRKNYLFF